jgi:hypothetical protein
MLATARPAPQTLKRPPIAWPQRPAGDHAIADRGEFVDALWALARGGVLVRVSDLAGGWVIDGRPVFTSQRTLLEWQLVDEYDNPEGFALARYFRLNRRGRDFAERAVTAWKEMPLGQRLLARLMG